MICRINKNIKKGCSPYVLPDVREIYLLNYSDFNGYDVDNCEYCLDWNESSKFYRIDVQNASFSDSLAIGNNQNKYRNVRLTFSLYNSKDACVEEAYNAIVLGKYVAVFFTNGVWYVSGLLNGMTVNESASDSESHTITLEENTTLTSQILNAECAQDVVDSANGEEPTPPEPPTPTTDYILAVFDVDDTSEPTKIMYDSPSAVGRFVSVEIDGEEIDPITTTYQLSEGLHFIKYVPVDNTIINGLFDGCVDMEEIFIPDTYTTIGQYAFRNCTGLTSITIPDSVTSIGGYAFNGCSSLISVAIPSGVTTIGTDTFKNCTGLTSITIPDSVTSIGMGAFSNCYSLTSITIPNSVTTINNSAFLACDSLTSVTIPDSVTSIGQQVFKYCTGLTSITIEATTPPTLGINAFDNTNDCPIYVPAASVEAYKTATNWSRYASRIYPIT